MWPEGTRHSEVVTNVGVFHATPVVGGWHVTIGREVVVMTPEMAASLAAFLASLSEADK